MVAERTYSQLDSARATVKTTMLVDGLSMERMSARIGFTHQRDLVSFLNDADPAPRVRSLVYRWLHVPIDAWEDFKSRPMPVLVEPPPEPDPNLPIGFAPLTRSMAGVGGRKHHTYLRFDRAMRMFPTVKARALIGNPAYVAIVTSEADRQLLVLPYTEQLAERGYERYTVSLKDGRITATVAARTVVSWGWQPGEMFAVEHKHGGLLLSGKVYTG